MLKRLLRTMGVGVASSDAVAGYGEQLLTRVRSRLANPERYARGANAFDTAAMALLDEEERDGLPAYREQDATTRVEFARAWLSLVIENDAMPRPLQLVAEELARPRALLASFYFGVTEVQREAHAVMSQIDDKFRAGNIGQAALLLGLFDTDAATRRSNERNLFYEEMIVSFMGERKRHSSPLVLPPTSTASTFEALHELASWTASHTGVHLCVRARSNVEATLWDRTFEEQRLVVDPTLPDIVGWRWRDLAPLEVTSTAGAVAQHVSQLDAAAHALRSLRAVYFIVLATGRIGVESLIFDFVDWLPRAFDTSPTRLLPDLHRACTIDDEPLSAGLGLIGDLWLARPVRDLSSVQETALTQACDRVYERLASIDYATLPEGCYDLGALVADELLGFRATTATDALRLHRLT